MCREMLQAFGENCLPQNVQKLLIVYVHKLASLMSVTTSLDWVVGALTFLVKLI
jgi:hypothetical protein